jgi:hypothetical protein
MNFEQIRKRADQLRAIPLISVLRVWGAQPDPLDNAKWHTPQGVLSVTGTKFINWNRGVGGGGAIDLVIHLNNCPFKEALNWLGRHFPAAAFHTEELLASSDLKLPPPDPTQLRRVRHYLIQKRCLPSTLIEPLIQSGALYADRRANAVFLLLGENNIPVGAELRGTNCYSWRGMAPGSKKDLGFFSIPTNSVPVVILCESAIDAISCFALHPQHRCISTAGVRPNPRWLVPLLNQGHQVYCGFDTDTTGEAMARAMISLYPSIRRLAPPRHDWNDALLSNLE